MRHLKFTAEQHAIATIKLDRALTPPDALRCQDYVQWNDTSGRTFEEVRALLIKTGV